jgi:hypothetical protein
METSFKGLDLTEQEFDVINARVTQAFKADGIDGDNYATKSNRTTKGYWMQIVSGFEKYFTQEELNSAVEYIAKEEITEPDINLN